MSFKLSNGTSMASANLKISLQWPIIVIVDFAPWSNIDFNISR